MRYVALIEDEHGGAPLVLGVGETHNLALGGAHAWFKERFDAANSREWPRLIALQDRLTIWSEPEILPRTGLSLDEWLAKYAAAGRAPKSAPLNPATPSPPLDPRPPRTGAEFSSILYLALLGIAVIGAFWAVRYAGHAWLQGEIDDALTNGNGGVFTGVVEFEPIATVDIGNFGIFDPGDIGDPGGTIDGIATGP